MPHEIIHPQDWAPAKGYANGVLARGGATLYIAGQIAWNERQELQGRGDLGAQFLQCLGNVLAVLQEAGGQPQDLVRMTVYVTDKQAYLLAAKDIGQGWRELLGRHYPAMALVQVADLLEPGAMVEIEATAVLPS